MTTQRSPRRFFSLLLTLICLAAGGTGSLRAEDIKYPSDGSGIAFSLPDGWTSADGDKGSLKCVAADGKFDVRFQTGSSFNDPAADLEKLGKGMAEQIKLENVVAEAGKEVTMPGDIKLLSYNFQGKLEGTEMTGSLILFTTASGSKTLLVVFDSTEDVNAHGKELTALIKSVKSAK